MQVVLQRRACEQQAEGRDDASERAAQRRRLVLEPVALINGHGVEEEALGEEGLLGAQRVVRREVHVKGGPEHGWVREEAVPLALATMHLDEAQAGREALHLVGPVLQHGQRRDDQVRSGQAGRLERREEGERLDCLTQPHLVAEDASGAEAVLTKHPVDARDLIGAQRGVHVRLGPVD